MFSARRIAALTGITRAEWRELRTAFPELPAAAGQRAAGRRLLLARLASLRLRLGRWQSRVAGDSPRACPTVYVSAHFGSLQALRYTLRARGVPVATVLGPHNLERSESARQDRVFDARHPIAFPHVLPAAQVHRLRTALRSGSLVLAADLPEGRGVAFPLLGGTVALDPRPFRLARAARVPCRPAFLTLPRGRWTLTLGDPVPDDEAEALAAFARILRRVAEASPTELDGVVYRAAARARGPAPPRAQLVGG
jgi:hypothetical protein